MKITINNFSRKLVATFAAIFLQSSIGTTYAKADLSNAVTVNLAQNGYAKFNNGLLIQWGFSGIGGYNTIYFPMSFYNTNYNLTANERISSTQAIVYSIHLLNMYTSYFTVRGRYHASSGNSGDMNDQFYWLAIGRWK